MVNQTIIRRKKGEYGWSYKGLGNITVRNLTEQEAQRQAENYVGQVAFDWQTARQCRIVKSYLQKYPGRSTGCIVVEAVLLDGFDRNLMAPLDLYPDTALD